MKKRSVLYLWITEFVLFLVLTGLLCVLMAYFSRQKLLQEYESVTETQQSKLELALDSTLLQLQAQGISTATDVTIRSFAAISSPEVADNYSLWIIKNELASKKNAARYVNNTLVYFYNLDKAIGSETVYSKSDVVRLLYGHSGTEQITAFEDLIDRPELNSLRVITREESGDTCVVMLTSIPTNGRSVQAMVIQILDMSEIETVTNSTSLLEDATTVLLTSSGDILCWNGTETLLDEIVAAYLRQVPDGSGVLDESRYHYQAKTFSAGLALVTVIPMETIARRSSWVQRLSFVVLSVYLLVGGSLAVFSILRNYRPLRQLKQSLPAEAKSVGDNEFEQLDFALQTIQRDREDMRLMQKRQRQAMLSDWLRNVMAYDIPVTSPSEIQILNQLGLNSSQVDAQSISLWFQLFLLTGDETDWLPAASDHVFYVAPHGKQIVCFLADSEAELRTLVQGYSQSFLEAEIPLHNAPTFGLEQLHGEFIALCSREESEDNRSDGAAVGSEKQISACKAKAIQAIFSGEQEAACAAVEGWLLGLDAECSLYLLQMNCADFLLELYRAIPDTPAADEVRDAVLATWRTSQRTVNRSELQDILKTLSAAAAAKYVRPAPSEEDTFLNEITRCVNEHFLEHDFNVSRMADLLGVNVTYLSKYFKSHTGFNLLSYLNGLRIDYAKKLISEEKITIAAAADRAGFENVNTFIRLFKKYVGDTPGNYSRR